MVRGGAVVLGHVDGAFVAVAVAHGHEGAREAGLGVHVVHLREGPGDTGGVHAPLPGRRRAEGGSGGGGEALEEIWIWIWGPILRLTAGSGEGHNGFPNDSAHRPAMPYDAPPGPRWASPSVPSGGGSHGLHGASPHGSRGTSPWHSGPLPPSSQDWATPCSPLVERTLEGRKGGGCNGGGRGGGGWPDPSLLLWFPPVVPPTPAPKAQENFLSLNPLAPKAWKKILPQTVVEEERGGGGLMTTLGWSIQYI